MDPYPAGEPRGARPNGAVDRLAADKALVALNLTIQAGAGAGRRRGELNGLKLLDAMDGGRVSARWQTLKEGLMVAVSGRLVQRVLRALENGDFDNHRSEVAEQLRQRVQRLHGLGERYAAVRLSAYVEAGSTLILLT